MRRDGGEHFYPLAVGDPALRLPAGSIVVTGTPEGVVIGQVAPSPLALVFRGLLHLRSPFEQFVAEEKERATAARGNYLQPGDRVRARIDGLGTQEFAIGPAGAPQPEDPCARGGAPPAASGPSQPGGNT
jgi:hypothetical protein